MGERVIILIMVVATLPSRLSLTRSDDDTVLRKFRGPLIEEIEAVLRREAQVAHGRLLSSIDDSNDG